MLRAYIDFISQPSRALYMFLKFTQIPHTICKVAVSKGEQRKPEYAKINPFKAVPAIDDDGFCLSESVAILQYLCSKHNIDSLYPKDLQQRAKIEAFTHWHHYNLQLVTAQLSVTMVMEPLRTGKPVDDKKVQFYGSMLKSSLGKLEGVFLKDTPFINSHSLSIADFLCVSHVMQVKLGLKMNTKNYPKIEEWTQLVRESIGSSIFDDAHVVIAKTGENIRATQIPPPKL